MITQRKSEILASTDVDAKGGVEKKDIQGRNLLSLLIKANVATDIPDSARMSDEDILSRESSHYVSHQGPVVMTITTPKRFRPSSLLGMRQRGICNFLLESERLFMRGSFSTSVGWGLYALGSNPGVHDKLNAEARAFYTDTPSMEELNEMTYLDYFTREVLRLYAPVSQTERVAQEDIAVPVSRPYVDRHGIQRNEIRCVV